LRLILLFAIFALLGLALETANFHLVSFRPLIPNLIVILAVDLGFRHHGAIAALLAFSIGYATDAFAGSHPGLNAFMITLIYVVCYEISSRLLVTNAFVGATVVFFGVILTALGAIALSAGIEAVGQSGGLMPSLMLQAGISAIVAPFVFSILARCKRAIGLPVAPARE
jgi:rod shape-determining protein MreD